MMLRRSVPFSQGNRPGEHNEGNNFATRIRALGDRKDGWLHNNPLFKKINDLRKFPPKRICICEFFTIFALNNPKSLFFMLTTVVLCVAVAAILAGVLVISSPSGKKKQQDAAPASDDRGAMVKVRQGKVASRENFDPTGMPTGEKPAEADPSGDSAALSEVTPIEEFYAEGTSPERRLEILEMLKKNYEVHVRAEAPAGESGGVMTEEEEGLVSDMYGEGQQPTDERIVAPEPFDSE